MAKVKIDSIIDHLNVNMRRALEDAVKSSVTDAEFDRNALFREFFEKSVASVQHGQMFRTVA